MSAEYTVLNIVTSNSTNLTVSSESTVLTAAPATIFLPVSLNLSNSIPLELSENGSAGISSFAARADHVHPSTGMPITGGNF